MDMDIAQESNNVRPVRRSERSGGGVGRGGGGGGGGGEVGAASFILRHVKISERNAIGDRL